MLLAEQTEQEPQALGLAAEAEELNQVLAQLHAMTITTPQAADELNELVKEFKRELKQLEENCTSTTRPTFERLEAMRDWFRPKRNALKELERVGKLKLAEYASRLRAAQTSAQATAGAAFAAGNVAAGHAALAASPQAADLQGTSFRETLDFQITDASQVPAQFWSPDPVKIKAFIDSTGGQHPIPGVLIVRKPVVTVRT